MILADTSVWIDHFRGRAPEMARRLDAGEILIHPFVTGELLLSGLHRHRAAMATLRDLPAAPVVQPEEVEALIVNRQLDGRGIGYVDSVLLASVLVSGTARLWTLDGKLRAAAGELGVSAPL